MHAERQRGMVKDRRWGGGGVQRRKDRGCEGDRDRKKV